MKKLLSALLILLLALPVSREAWAQPAPLLPRYAATVVAIRALATSGDSENGSGFVVGSTPDSVYIATAGHVLMEPTAKVTVLLETTTLYRPAKVRYFAYRGTDDLALIAVAARQYQWVRFATAYSLTPDDDLCFIRAASLAEADPLTRADGAAYSHKEQLPVNNPAAMRSQNKQAHTISFELKDVLGGDSGSALLVVADKVYIVGMIMQSSIASTQNGGQHAQNEKLNLAISIDYIRRTLQPILGSKWQLTSEESSAGTAK